VLSFITDNTTRITNGTFADIKVVSRVEARFDPVTMVAARITLQGNANRNENQEKNNNGRSRGQQSARLYGFSSVPW